MDISWCLSLNRLITSTLRYDKLPHEFEKMTQLRNISFGDRVLQYDLFNWFSFSHLALTLMKPLAITFNTSL